MSHADLLHRHLDQGYRHRKRLWPIQEAFWLMATPDDMKHGPQELWIMRNREKDLQYAMVLIISYPMFRVSEIKVTRGTTKLLRCE